MHALFSVEIYFRMVVALRCSGPSSCNVTAYLASAWPLSGPSPSYANVVNLYVTSNDNRTISVPWTLSISNPAYKTTEQVQSKL